MKPPVTTDTKPERKLLHRLLIGAGLVATGVLLSYLWISLHNPMKPMYVEIINATQKLIPSVVIEHGSKGLQEEIMLLQLEPKEARTIAINHQPGMGFNVRANIDSEQPSSKNTDSEITEAQREKEKDKNKMEICAGKKKGYWFVRATITPFGIYSESIR